MAVAETLDLPHQAPINGLHFNNTGTQLITSDDSGYVCVVDWTTRKRIESFGTGHDWLFGTCPFPDGRHLAAANPDGTVGLWETQSWSHVQDLAGHLGQVSAIQLTTDAKTLISASEDRQVLVREVGSREQRFVLKHPLKVESLAVSSDSKLLATGDWGGTIRIWNLEAGTAVAAITAAGPSDGIMCLAFSPDGKKLFSGAQDGALRVWDAETWKEVKSIHVQSRTIRAIIPWSDGRTLISASQDGTIVCLDIQSGRHLTTLGHHAGTCVLRLALSPDAATLVSGDLEGRVKLWDLRDRHELSRVATPHR